MSIRTNEPKGGGKVVLHAVATLLAAESAHTPDPGGAALLEVAAPHPVYVATIADVASKRLLASATQNGWRYLVFRGGRAIASANVDRRGNHTRFTRCSRGPFVDSTLRAIGMAERLHAVKESDFELRLLDVPGLSLRALWLNGAEQDILVPLEPAPPPLKGLRKYTEAAVVKALSSHAHQLLEHPGDDEEELPLASSVA